MIIYKTCGWCGFVHTLNTDEYYPIEEKKISFDCDCGTVVWASIGLTNPETAVRAYGIKTW